MIMPFTFLLTPFLVAPARMFFVTVIHIACATRTVCARSVVAKPVTPLMLPIPVPIIVMTVPIIMLVVVPVRVWFTMIPFGLHVLPNALCLHVALFFVLSEPLGFLGFQMAMNLKLVDLQRHPCIHE